MQRRFWAASLVVALAAFSLTFVGCGQVNKLKAKKAYKEANMLYQQQDYKRAAERYEEVVVNDDTLMGVYFFLGNSYDNLYKPSRKGEAQNDAYLTKAVESYKKGVQVEQDKTLKTRCLQYLVAAYGPDKLNDPSQAEPLLNGDDQDRPEGAGQLRHARQDVRGRRPVRHGRADAAEGEGRQPDGRRTSTSSSPATTTARASSTRRWPRSTRARRKTRTIQSATTPSRILLGKGLPRLPAEEGR